MPGVFSLNEGNIEIQNKVAELNEESNKLAVQYQEKKNALTDAKGKLPALRIALESSCWETTADIRNRFAKALAGKRGKNPYSPMNCSLSRNLRSKISRY